MKTHRLVVPALVWVLMVLSHGALSSQEVWNELKGERVRITYDSRERQVVAGVLREVMDEAFLVASSPDRVVPIPRDQVADFQVLRGTERRWKNGLWIGAASGAITGALLYMLLEASVEGIFGGNVESSPGPVAYGAVGALYGGAIGLGIGALIRRDRWESVPLGSVIPSFRIAPDKRLDFGISIPLRR